MLKNSLKNLIARGSYAWLILLLSPLLVSRSSEFLGQDVSAIAAGILGFYPWVAVGQFVLLGILSWLVTLIVAFAVKIIWPQVKPSFHCSLILLYFFACFSFSLLKYPAFFTDFIPQYLDRIVWMVAKYVSPDIPLDILIISPVIIVGSRLLYLGGKKAAQRNGRIFGVLCCIFVVFLGVWYREGKNSSRQGSLDHILIVAIDSLRFDGISEEKTPHLWALKHHDRTVTFQDHIVGIPRTFPSWLEILSGQYASQTGIRHMFPAFDVREKNRLMMGDVLKKMGFSTFLVSDFAGDIFPRFRTGFSIVDAPTLTISEIIKFNITQQFRLYLPIFVRLSQWGFYGLFQQSPTLADPKRIADKFFDLKPRDGSWMGMLFFSTAHFPYAAPHPYYRKFVDNGYSGEFFFKKNPDIKISGQKINDHERKQVIALYDGALNAVDQQVGRIIESLKKTGEWDQTTLILTADHGEQLYDDGILQGHGEHLRGEWVLKVPLLIKIGGMNAISKRVVHAVTQSVDIFPTLLGILGEKKPEFLPGIDYSNYIYNREGKQKREFGYAETGIWFARSGQAHFQKNRIDYPGISGLLEFDIGRSDEITLNQKFEQVITIAKHRAIISENFKLIYIPTHLGAKFELYDRTRDPNNERNIISEYPEVFEDLRKKLKHHVIKYEQEYEMQSDFFVPIFPK